jgi:hypothetical protein
MESYGEIADCVQMRCFDEIHFSIIFYLRIIKP